MASLGTSGREPVAHRVTCVSSTGVSAPIATLAYLDEAGHQMPVHVWHFPAPALAIASGPLGGGLGVRAWVLNATVDKAYARLDSGVHLTEIAQALHLAGPGVGMLTAVDVRDSVAASDGGAHVVATVGLGHPTWASAPDGDLRRVRPSWPGTINIAAWIPVALSEAALVNAASTATEAKIQALWAHGVEATGTATDAVCVACVPFEGSGHEPEKFGGPRSVWGGRLARAVHAAVLDGTRKWLGRDDDGPSRS